MRVFAGMSIALVIGIAACSSLLDPAIPADAPGVRVTDLVGECPRASTYFARCMVWSADSKSLYVQANLGATLGRSLVKIDPATHSYLRIGGIGAMADMALSADGTAMYYTAPLDSSASVFGMHRMSLADGATTSVTIAGGQGILPSPDGTALSYHAPGSSAAADTIVVIDLPSGAHRATTTVVGGTFSEAWSPDGTQLLMKSFVSGGVVLQIWHLATGTRDTVQAPARYIRGSWTRGGFRSLVSDSTDSGLTDMAVAGGDVLKYPVTRRSDGIAWVPERSAA